MNAAGFPDYVLNGLVPFNTGDADVNGCFWYMDGEMAGWDSPDGRVTMLTKIGNNPNADGEIPADQHYRGRTLTWTLYAFCPTEAAREDARYLLSQALDLVDATGVLLVNEVVPKFVTISRSGNNQQGKLVETDSGLSSPAQITPGFNLPGVDENALMYPLKAEIELYCADPRKYAQAPIAANFGPVSGPIWGLEIDNPGNTATSNAVLTLAATGSPDEINIAIIGGGEAASTQLFVPSTPGPALSPIPPQLTVDLYNQTITDPIDTNYYYLRNLRTPWLYIPPGASQLTIDSDVAGYLTYYPAWI